MLKRVLAAILAATVLVPAAASAADVVVTPGTGQRSLAVSFFDPLGQSFTAGATDLSLQSFGFQFQTLNTGAANSPLTFTLRQGTGFGGTVLATTSLTPAGIPTTRTPTWVDFALNGVALTPGQIYTAAITSNSERYGLIYGPDINLSNGQLLGPNAYAGGTFLATGFNDAPCQSGNCDANFRYSAVGVAAAVPEPASWAMMIGGLGVVGGTLRRRRGVEQRLARA